MLLRRTKAEGSGRRHDRGPVFKCCSSVRMIVCKIVQTLPRDNVHTPWCSVYSEKTAFLQWAEHPSVWGCPAFYARGAQYSAAWSLSRLSRSLRRTMCSYSVFSSEDRLPEVLMAASSVTCPARSLYTASMAASNLSKVCVFSMTLRIACEADNCKGNWLFLLPWSMPWAHRGRWGGRRLHERRCVHGEALQHGLQPPQHARFIAVAQGELHGASSHREMAMDARRRFGEGWKG